MTITLTCSFCGRRETRTDNPEFPGWYWIIPHWVTPQEGHLQRKNVCSEECGASWLMRRQLERERVKEGAKEEP